MHKKKEKEVLKKLTGRNMILICACNLFIPICLFGAALLLIDFQVEGHYIKAASAGYYVKVFFLCLLLGMLILGVLDYLYLIKPMLHLEGVIEEYKTLTRMEDQESYDKYFAGSSLENVFLKMISEQKFIEKRNEIAESQRQETELLALQTQINPHFLYNTLDSIRGLALIHGVDEIASMTEALSRLFRNMIAKEGKLLTLREELENVENYMLIQEFRFHNRFSFLINVTPDLLDRYLIPNLILQPIVENAIMHGLEKKNGTGHLTISGYVTEKRLILDVMDDGVGMKEETLEFLKNRLKSKEYTKGMGTSKFHTGIALLNINQRIKLTFGELFGITLESTPLVGSTTELVLPCIEVQTEHIKGDLYE